MAAVFNEIVSRKCTALVLGRYPLQTPRVVGTTSHAVGNPIRSPLKLASRKADTSATVIALAFLVMNLEYIFVLVRCLALLWVVTRDAGAFSWRCSVDIQAGLLRLLDSLRLRDFGAR